jgi:NAD(P)-dependent dehydrogenase (short-subunit alcohol dehydrogenase family)
MFSLQDKVALVTGAGSGLGKQIALLYAKQGAKVVASDRNPEKLDALITEVPAGLTVSTVVGDISKLADVRNMFAYAQETFGQLDIVVNNAGVMDKLQPIGEVDDEMFERVMNINLKGTFYMTREAVRVFEPKGKGVIVNIASVAGLEGGRAGAVYTASKHGIIGLTKNTGYSYAKSGIRCNAIAPGAMNTNIMGGINFENLGIMVKAMLATRGNQKVADPLEVANVALFLASDEASFVNGAVFVADGGWTSY